MKSPEAVSAPQEETSSSPNEVQSAHWVRECETILMHDATMVEMNPLCRYWEYVQQFCHGMIDGEESCDEYLYINVTEGNADQELKSLTIEEENEMISHTNPSRIAPRIFLAIPNARKAIEDELTNLLAPDKSGIPSLQCQPLGLKENRYRAAAASTVVVKKKIREHFQSTPMCPWGFNRPGYSS